MTKHQQDQHAALLRIIRLRELPTYVGLQRTQIDELIRNGEFPAPVKLSDSGRAKGWLEHEVIAWQQERLAKRDNATKRRSR
jgi:predicted DNA-binding transcriptional regulator AlpA